MMHRQPFIRPDSTRAANRVSIAYRASSLAVTVCLASVFAVAGLASADEVSTEEIVVPVPVASTSGSLPTATGDDHFHHPDDWAVAHPDVVKMAEDAQLGPYGTYYLMPFTRHLPDSGLEKGWQYVIYPFAVVFDIGQLPFGVFAGLYGD